MRSICRSGNGRWWLFWRPHGFIHYLLRFLAESRRYRRKQSRCPQFISLLKTWEYLKYMYLIELDETNRLSLISSFCLNPFQSYSQKTIFVNRSKGHNSHDSWSNHDKTYMFLVELDERNIFLLRFFFQRQNEIFHKIQREITPIKMN